MSKIAVFSDETKLNKDIGFLGLLFFSLFFLFYLFLSKIFNIFDFSLLIGFLSFLFFLKKGKPIKIPKEFFLLAVFMFFLAIYSCLISFL